MIQVILYNNTKQRPHMGRSLSIIYSGSIPDNVIEKMDLLDPVVTVANDVFPLWSTANYMYLGAPFNRYYFLKSPRAGEDGITRMDAHVDVLYTHRLAILSSQCIAERSSNRYNVNLQDSYIKPEEGYRYNFTKFPYKFDPSEGDYILITTGG